MKLFFRAIFIVWISSVNARDIMIITYQAQKETASLVEKIMSEKFKIPVRLITKRWQKNPCSPIKNAIYQVCLKDDGSILFPVLKKEVLSRSFQIFYQK